MNSAVERYDRLRARLRRATAGKSTDEVQRLEAAFDAVLTDLADESFDALSMAAEIAHYGPWQD